MKRILLALIAGAMLMVAAPGNADARPWGYWGPRAYYRPRVAYYAPPVAVYRPYRVYRPYAYPAYGPGFYYGGPGVSVGVGF